MRKSSTISMAFLVVSCYSVADADMKVYFDKDNNTYNWVTSINYTMGKDRNRFKSYFDGQSNLIKGGFSRWQENATTGFDSQASIKNRLGLVLQGEYTVNGLERRRVKTTELAMGFSIKPSNFMELRPVIRAANKIRSELEAQTNEKGAGYGLRGEIIPTIFKGISLGGIISYDRVNLSNIPWQIGEGAFSAFTGYGNIDTVRVSLKGTEATKKYYSTGGKVTGITRQIKQERDAVFALNMRLPERFRLKIDGGTHLSRYLYRQDQTDIIPLTQRDNFGRGEDYQVSVLENIGDFAQVSINYLWSSRREDFRGLELDLNTDKGELSFHGVLAFTPGDSITTDLTFGVTSYSNPNPERTMENRDQKTILVNGGYSHRFSRYFSLGATGGANSFHQIYVSGARSANNGRNDTYILTPYAIWSPVGNLSIKQSFDIQANYITFDFDRKKITTKNRLFRRATSKTEMSLDISERLRLIQGYTYRYEDYGLLIWEDGWQQSVSWDRRRNGLETRVVYRPVEKIRLTPHFLWEKTGDYHRAVNPGSDIYDPTEIRYLKDEQVKMFFEFEMAFFWSDSRNLIVDFSHRLRKFMGRPRETNNYIKVSMEYLF